LSRSRAWPRWVPTDEERLKRAVEALDAGRPAGQYRLLLPMAEAGHPEAMAAVGVLLFTGSYRHEAFANIPKVAEPIPPFAEGRRLAARVKQREGGRFKMPKVCLLLENR
jgi:hypothetical protein